MTTEQKPIGVPTWQPATSPPNNSRVVLLRMEYGVLRFGYYWKDDRAFYEAYGVNRKNDPLLPKQWRDITEAERPVLES